MTDSKLVDPYNRRLNYLRVSITDRCNLRCGYCVPRDLILKIPHRDILRYEEILRLVRIGVHLGIEKVRITGGEPLVRKGVYDFLEALSGIEGLRDRSLTTNGILLSENAQRIHRAGIRRINVSLDTLDREKYRAITGEDGFAAVWNGLERALEIGFDPIKINVVALSGINDEEIAAIAALTLTHPFHVRFIEYMPIGSSRLSLKRSILAPEIRRRVETLGKLFPVEGEEASGPAERFRFEGARGEVGFIRPMSRHFCRTCNRLRLTADGRLRPCLMSDATVDIRTPLRKGLLDDALRDVFLQAVRRKPQEHRLTDTLCDPVDSQMCAIGG